MRYAVKFLFWGGLAMGFTALFYFLAPIPAQAVSDAGTPVVVITDAGCVATTIAEYLPHAVAAEMPASFHPAALMAQAVACRTYVLASDRHDNGDVCTDSGCCMAYLDEQALQRAWGDNYAKNWRAVTQAVTATDGEYLTYNGAAIQAVFHASSRGATEYSGAIWSPLPYLVSVSSPERAEDVPGLMTTVEVSAPEFAAALGVAPTDDPAVWIEDVALESSGRVRTLTVAGQAFSGVYIRDLFGLRSTDFTVSWDGSVFCFTVAGSGHGVGMSQYGANAYAAQGWDYRQILAHYYPGTELAVCG